MEGFITLRECRRKGFSEAESRQLCMLEPRLLELYEHAPTNGGLLSVRIKRAGSLDGPEETWGRTVAFVRLPRLAEGAAEKNDAMPAAPRCQTCHTCQTCQTCQTVWVG